MVFGFFWVQVFDGCLLRWPGCGFGDDGVMFSDGGSMVQLLLFMFVDLHVRHHVFVCIVLIQGGESMTSFKTFLFISELKRC